MSRLATAFLAPTLSGRDVTLALRLLTAPWLWQRGEATATLEAKLTSLFGAAEVHTVTSGRWALKILLQGAGCAHGEEVLLQAYTCVSVPGPVLWAGLRPVYVDVNHDTLTMDPSDLRRKITPRSRVLIIQHTFGVPARLEELLAIARERHLIVIEDCAHTLGSRRQGQLLGTFGDAAIVSFGRDKALTSVFGGAALIKNPSAFPQLAEEMQTLGDAPRHWILQQLLYPVLIVCIIRPLFNALHAGKMILVLCQRLRILSKALAPREKRGGRPAVPLARLPNALAALAVSQLRHLAAWNLRRQTIARIYDEGLRDAHVARPPTRLVAQVPLLRYTIRLPDAWSFRQQARARGILLGDWYDTVVAPRTTDLAAVGYVPHSCPVAERAARESVNLPAGPNLSDEDAQRIVQSVASQLHDHT